MPAIEFRAASCRQPRVASASLPIMQGVDEIAVGRGHLVIVRELSDELKSHISAHLAAICHGRATSDEDPAYYSFGKTLDEFLARIDTKPWETQLGMLGEFLTHVLAPSRFPDVILSSVYFNKEERNVKKGFDLTFARADWSRVWYSEVKAGELHNGTATDKIRALIGTAVHDLREKLSDPSRRSLWDSAVDDAAKVLASPNARSVRDLLRADWMAANDGHDWEKYGLVCAVLFHPIATSEVNPAELEARLETVDGAGFFAGLEMLAVQKSTALKVLEFLREKAAAQ